MRPAHSSQRENGLRDRGAPRSRICRLAIGLPLASVRRPDTMEIDLRDASAIAQEPGRTESRTEEEFGRKFDRLQVNS